MRSAVRFRIKGRQLRIGRRAASLHRFIFFESIMEYLNTLKGFSKELIHRVQMADCPEDDCVCGKDKGLVQRLTKRRLATIGSLAPPVFHIAWVP